MTELNLICIPADLRELYEGARDDHEPYAPCVVSRLIERVARAEDGQQLATLKQDNDALRSSDLALREQIKALNETIASQAAAIRSMSKPIDRQHKRECVGLNMDHLWTETLRKAREFGERGDVYATALGMMSLLKAYYRNCPCSTKIARYEATERCELCKQVQEMIEL